jgi:hypothetical protein
MMPQSDDTAHDVPVPGGTPGPEDGRYRRFVITGCIILAVIIGVVFVLPGIAASVWGAGGHPCCARVVIGDVKQPDNSTIVIRYLGGPDARSVTGMTATVTDSTGLVQSKMIGTQEPLEKIGGWSVFSHPDKPPVIPELPPGENITFSGKFNGKDHVVAKAYLCDDDSFVYVVDTDI